MKMPTPEQLKADISGAPDTFAALVKTGNDSAIAAIYNAKTLTAQGPIPMASVLIWAVANKLVVPLQKIAADDADPLQDAAAGILIAIGGGMPFLDVTNPLIDGMVVAFVATKRFGEEAKAELYAAGQVPASLAEVKWGIGTVISTDAVAIALRGNQ